MFGCSDVYHWMGRAAKAVCFRTADNLPWLHYLVPQKITYFR